MIYDFLGVTLSGVQLFFYFFIAISSALLLLYRLRNSYDAAVLLTGDAANKQLLINFSLYRHMLKTIFLFLGIIFLLIAIARPRWGKQEKIIKQQGRDLFIALDISRSMLAQDVPGNRLELAKEKIRALLSKLKCDRVGLILFSGSTFVQCPLTTDYSSFHMFLDQIDTETISSGTTSIDQAIKRTLEAFEQIPGRKNKLLVLFTDGEDFSHNLSGVKEKALTQGLHIFAVGVGTKEGAPIPLTDVAGNAIGYQKDVDGSIVISKINEDLLRAVAQESGGTYLRATENYNDIEKLVKQVQKFEKEALEDKKVHELQERYYYFLAMSFFCLVVEWLL